MFLHESDRPHYSLVAARGFFDKELSIPVEAEAQLVSIQERALLAQEFLAKIYSLGDHPKVELPEWLKEEVSASAQRKQATAQGSSKTLRLPQKTKASGLNTSPDTSVTKGSLEGTPPTSDLKTESTSKPKDDSKPQTEKSI